MDDKTCDRCEYYEPEHTYPGYGECFLANKDYTNPEKITLTVKRDFYCRDWIRRSEDE